MMNFSSFGTSTNFHSMSSEENEQLGSTGLGQGFGDEQTGWNVCLPGSNMKTGESCPSVTSEEAAPCSSEVVSNLGFQQPELRREYQYSNNSNEPYMTPYFYTNRDHPVTTYQPMLRSQQSSDVNQHSISPNLARSAYAQWTHALWLQDQRLQTSNALEAKSPSSAATGQCPRSSLWWIVVPDS